MSAEFRIDELDTNVLFAKGEGLRNTGEVTLYDLISVGNKNGKNPLETLKLVARQMYLYNNPYSYIYDGKRDIAGVFGIINKKNKLPFIVANTALTSLTFGLGENVNPRHFIENIVKFYPTPDELEGYSKTDIEKISKGPAILAGSAVIIHWDGIDENKILLSRRKSGAYKNKLTIPGGHADAPLDAFALHEVIEETGLSRSVVRGARPLGIADQLIFSDGDSDTPELVRYLNFIWQIDASFDKRVYFAEDLGWMMYDDDEISVNELTPIAKLAIGVSGFPIWIPSEKH